MPKPLWRNAAPKINCRKIAATLHRASWRTRGAPESSSCGRSLCHQRLVNKAREITVLKKSCARLGWATEIGTRRKNHTGNPPRTPWAITAPSATKPNRRTQGRGSRSQSHTASTMVSRPTNDARSEEHTSELQSPCNLVCRLLLEKKKQTTSSQHAC